MRSDYITDVPWEPTYQPFLNPHYTRFALAVSGVTAPAIRTCCELAYGQGLSITLHAACNHDMSWIGTDFNPGHVAFASRLSAGIRLANLRLHGEPLGSFCRRDDLTDVDLVGIIGTWSWVSPSDQQAIGEFLQTKLRSKGLFGLDHMTLPGMNGMTELRRLLVAFAAPEKQGKYVDRLTGEQVHRAVKRTLDFLDLQPNFMHRSWTLKASLEKMLIADSESLLHEYFNCYWEPRYFLETVNLLEGFGLSWVASWSLTDSSPDRHFTPRQQAYLSTLTDFIQREHLKDFFVNRSGRSDIWARAKAFEPSSSPSEHLRAERVILVKPKGDFDYRSRGALGEVALSRALYGQLLAALGNHRPVCISKLEEKLRGRANFHEIIDALAILVEQEFLKLVNPSDTEIERSSPTSRAVNRNILEIGRQGDMVGYLGSPVTGGGIKVSDLHQYFLLAREEGAKFPEQYVRFAKDISAKRESSSSKNENLDRIDSEAEIFQIHYLPIYRALRMIEGT